MWSSASRLIKPILAVPILDWFVRRLYRVLPEKYRNKYPWGYYLAFVKEIINDEKFESILKTDADNEAFGRPVKGGVAGNIPIDVTLLEYETEVIARAKNNVDGVNIVQGDIRSLPFDDQSFDCVVDLSTIDHIPFSDLGQALFEYHRVARRGLIIVVWLNDNVTTNSDGAGWSSTDQYFFSKEEFLDVLTKYFKVVRSNYGFFSNEEGGYLGCVFAEKLEDPS